MPKDRSNHPLTQYLVLQILKLKRDFVNLSFFCDSCVQICGLCQESITLKNNNNFFVKKG